MAGILLALSHVLLLLLSAGGSWAWTTTTLPSSFSQLSIIDHQQRTYHHQTLSRIHQNYQPSHHHHNVLLLSATPTTDESTTTRTDDITVSSILKDINPNSLPILHIQKRIGSGSYGTVHQGLFIKSQDNVQRCITKRCWTSCEIENNVPLQIYNMEKEEKEREEDLAVAQRTGLASVKQQENGGDVVVVSTTTEEQTTLSKEEIKMKSERCKHYWNVEKHIFEKLTEKKKKKRRNSSSNEEVVLATPEFLGVYQDAGNDTTQEDNIIKGCGLLDTDDGWFSTTNTNDNGKYGGHEWMVFEFVGGEYNNDDEEMPAQTLLDAMEVSAQHTHTSIFEFSNGLDLIFHSYK